MAAGAPAVPEVREGLHRGSESDFGEDVDVEELIERHQCARVYYELEECLGEQDRDWTKCQDAVRALRRCNEERARGSTPRKGGAGSDSGDSSSNSSSSSSTTTTTQNNEK